MQKNRNETFLSWFTDEVEKTLEDLIVLAYEYFSFTPRLKRLNGGVMVREIVKNLDVKHCNSNSKKMYLYGTHDFTIAAITRALDIETFKMPPFGSAVIIEKYKSEFKSEYIKVTVIYSTFNGAKLD